MSSRSLRDSWLFCRRVRRRSFRLMTSATKSGSDTPGFAALRKRISSRESGDRNTLSRFTPANPVAVCSVRLARRRHFPQRRRRLWPKTPTTRASPEPANRHGHPKLRNDLLPLASRFARGNGNGSRPHLPPQAEDHECYKVREAARSSGAPDKTWRALWPAGSCPHTKGRKE